jgi:hypothetical protein
MSSEPGISSRPAHIRSTAASTALFGEFSTMNELILSLPMDGSSQTDDCFSTMK